jgi:hypothetical protein
MPFSLHRSLLSSFSSHATQIPFAHISPLAQWHDNSSAASVFILVPIERSVNLYQIYPHALSYYHLHIDLNVEQHWSSRVFDSFPFFFARVLEHIVPPNYITQTQNCCSKYQREGLARFELQNNYINYYLGFAYIQFIVLT